VVRSGVTQPVGPPASSSPGRCAFGLPGNKRYIHAPIGGGVDRSTGLRDQAFHGEHCRPSAPPLRSATGSERWCEWVYGTGLEKLDNIAAELGVTIEQDVAVGTGKRQSLAHLLYDPVAGRMLRDVEV
jgi:hypothetical protein